MKRSQIVDVAVRRDRGELEQEVLLAVGAADSALTPAQVLVALGGALAYTTVMTTLARLYRKGALVRERRGRAYAYLLAGPAASVASTLVAHQMRRLLDGDVDRAAVLARFVADLDPADEQLLASLVNDAAPPRPNDGD